MKTTETRWTAEDIRGLTALALRDAIRTGTITSAQAVDAYLEQIEQNAELGAFITVTSETARAQAAAADRLYEQLSSALPDEPGLETLPPLHGVPLAFKDLEDVAGVPTTMGSAAVPGTPSEEDSPGVAVLRRAGAISLGKTQVPEFGLTNYSENLIAKPARNPLDPRRNPGGSSGGSAAAIAAGMLPFGPGSDGGGSVRIPALACGLIGLKPEYGTISTDSLQGTHDQFGTPRLMVTGPIARTAADAAILFDAMREAPGEPALEAVQNADEVPSLRIGYSDLSPFVEAHPINLPPQAVLAFEEAKQRLLSLGHTVEHAGFDYTGYPENFRKGWTAGLSLVNLPEEAEALLTDFTRDYRRAAIETGTEANREAGAWLNEFRDSVRQQWGQYDLVLTPGLGLVPPRIGEFFEGDSDDNYRLQCEYAPYTSMVNVSGLPAIAIPIFRTPADDADVVYEEGGPVAKSPQWAWGVQLIGRPGSEELLLQMAQLLTGGPSAEVV